MFLLVFLCLFSRLLSHVAPLLVVFHFPFSLHARTISVFLFLILSITVSFCSIFLCIISLRIIYRLGFPSIPLSQLISATRSVLSSSLFRHQHCKPYSRSGITSVF